MTEKKPVFIPMNWPNKTDLEKLSTADLLKLSQAQSGGDKEGVIAIIKGLVESKLPVLIKKKGIQQQDK